MGFPAPIGVAADGTPATGDKANGVAAGSMIAVGPTRPFAFRGPMNVLIWSAVNTALTTTAGSLAATVTSGTNIAPGVAVNSSLVPLGTTIGAIAGTAATLSVPAQTYYGVPKINSTITGLSVTSGLLGATIVSPYYAAGTTVTGVLVNAVLSVNGAAAITGTVQTSSAPLSVPTDKGRVPLSFAVTGNAILTSGTDALATFTGAAISYSGSIQLERSFDGGATWLVCNIGTGGTLAQWAYGTPVSLTFGEPEREVLYRLNCTALTTGPINYRISQTGTGAESLAIGQLT